MTVTSQVLTHTPIPGHSFPSANKKRAFAKWVEAKEVRRTPWTDFMGSGSDVYEQLEIEIGQSYAPFITTTLGAQTANNSQNVTVASTALIRPGDILKATPLYSGSTTEYNDSDAERMTVLSITNSTVLVADRDEGQTASGSWPVIANGSRVQVVGRAQNYNEPFPDGVTYRGDSITQFRQIFDSGEIPYALGADRTPTYEAPQGHMMRDIMHWKNELPVYREDAFINGVKREGNYTSNPKIPYRLGGAIWFASQVGSNVHAIDGQINIFDISDILAEKDETHSDGVGDTAWGSRRFKQIWDEILLPYKGMFGANETSLTVKTNKVSFTFGDFVPRAAHKWPNDKVLITSASDWSWGHADGFNWTFVTRQPEELGAFTKSWTMGGEFSMVCKNITRQILLTGIDSRIDEYPARTAFM
jgi:hypothetical protein